MNKLIYSSIFILLFGQAIAQVPTSGLVANYPFCGNANDAGPNGYHLTAVNSPTLAADRFGNPNSAYSFNGTSNYFMNASFPQSWLTSSFTISIWLKNDGNQGRTYDGFISMGTSNSNHTFNFAFDRPNANFSYWDITNSSYYLTNGVSSVVDQWAHIVIVYDYTNHLLSQYVNNTLTDTKSINTISPRTSTQLNIGAYAGDAQYFLGEVDDVRIYNRILTSTERTALYTEGNYAEAITGPTSFCIGLNEKFSVPQGPVGTTYQWSLDGTVLADFANTLTPASYITFPTAGAHIVSVRTATNGLCYGQSVSKSVTVNDVPRVTAITGNGTVCQLSSNNYYYTYTVSPIESGATYGWRTTKQVGVTPPSTENYGTSRILTIPDIANQTFDIIIYPTNACGTGPTFTRTIQVNPNTYNKPNITCVAGTSCMTLDAGTPTSGTTIVWKAGNTTLGSSQTQVISSYLNSQISATFLKGTDDSSPAKSCAYTDYYYRCVPYSGGRVAEEIELPEENSYFIYPNPSTGSVMIETKGQVGKAYIYNMLGNLVSEVDLNEKEYFYTVNLATKGLYTFKIKSVGETKGYKVVVE